MNGYYGPTSTDPAQFLTLTTNASLYTLRLTNNSTTCGGPCGLYQTVASGIAIAGISANSMGVQGVTQSSGFDVAGVLGKDAVGAGSPAGFPSTGVMGEGWNGVTGITNTGGAQRRVEGDPLRRARGSGSRDLFPRHGDDVNREAVIDVPETFRIVTAGRRVPRRSPDAPPRLLGSRLNPK